MASIKRKTEQISHPPTHTRTQKHRAGDFNYRLDNIDADAAAACARAGDLSTLKKRDQLNKEKNAGRAFVGMSEAEISFAPTYKYDKHAPGLCFDSSEKRRVPAWCDRVLFRGSRNSGSGGGGVSVGAGGESDVAAAAASENAVAAAAGPLPPASVSCISYGSLPDVLDSDHKPVWATLRLTLAALDASEARHAAAEALEIADGEEEEDVSPSSLSSSSPLSATLAPDEIVLSRRARDLSPPSASAALANTGRVPLVWALRSSSSSSPPSSSSAAAAAAAKQGNDNNGGEAAARPNRPRHPSWLDVRPAGGLLLPGEAVELRLDAVVASSSTAADFAEGGGFGGSDSFSSYIPLAPPPPPPPPKGSRAELRVSAWRVGGCCGGGEEEEGGGAPWQRTLSVRLE